jgi:hypothetical protein
MENGETPARSRDMYPGDRLTPKEKEIFNTIGETEATGANDKNDTKGAYQFTLLSERLNKLNRG